MKSWIRLTGPALEYAASVDGSLLKRRFDGLHAIGVRPLMNEMRADPSTGDRILPVDIPEDPTGMLL